MKNFIQIELSRQMKLKFNLQDEDGYPIKPTGVIPRSLQMMASPIKEKIEIHYH